MTTAENTPKPPVRIDVWRVAYVVLIVLALITRLPGLGDRAVSHDETTHAKYSWNLYSGAGFRHDPLMHGPLLFEVTAILFGFFGVSDFTARLYAALAGVALVAAPWLLRKWTGRLGALLTSVMVLISPLITYYSRYARHDIPLLLFITLLLWVILEYLDAGDGGTRWLVWMGVLFALVFATKENAYIYTAIFLALMALPLVWQVVTTQWEDGSMARVVLGLLAIALLCASVFAVAYRQSTAMPEGVDSDETVPAWGRVALGAAALAGAGALAGVVRGVGERRIRRLRLFDVLLVLGTFTLPLGSALLMSMIAGVDMAAFYPALMSTKFGGIPLGTTIAAFSTLAISLAASVAIGLWWDRRRWPVIALAYYAVFFLLYSTFFTYGWGVLSGLVGGLAYWIAQQDVQRGSQPWYYYAMLQGLYEYLPLLVSLVGGVWAILQATADSGKAEAPSGKVQSGRVTELRVIGTRLKALWPVFLTGWAALSWVFYIIAGEKMPWLLVHITYPHILLAAWFLGRSMASWDLARLLGGKGWLVPVCLLCVALAWGPMRQLPGAVDEILKAGVAAESLEVAVAQLQPLGKGLGGVVGVVLCGGLLVWIVYELGPGRSLRLAGLTLLLVLAGLTVRTTVMAAYINDEMATEYLVYAHSTPDVKEVLAQIEEISWRTTGTPDQIKVAYGKETAWPFYWYMYSRYPNNYYFETPEADRLLDCPVILAERDEWEKVEAITGADYDSYDYRHIWWPVEDYKNKTWADVAEILGDRDRRKAIWDIVWKRDYGRYARVRNPDNPFTTETWPHRSEFRLYVRRDVADAAWAYEASGDGVAEAQEGDAAGAVPLQDHERSVVPVTTMPLTGAVPGGLAVAPDGTLYVADPEGHRIWHLARTGAPLAVIGGYGVEAGQFHTPSDVAVDTAGNIYVADTWNHRVQKLGPTGEPLLAWGRYAKVTTNDLAGWGGFYGPRGIDVGPEGHVYVADTGNSRVQVFDSMGEVVRVFGTAGTELGQLREPVGIAAGEGGEVFVTDSWNHRIQVFDAGGFPLRQWDVVPWGSLGIADRPYLAVTADAVLATDPAYGRLLVFDKFGELQWALRDESVSTTPVGVELVADGVVVSDSAGAQLLVYPLGGDARP